MAESVLPYISQIAKSLGSSVTLVSVATPTDDPDTATFVRRSYLDEVEERLSKQGIEAHSVVSSGDPAQQIIRVAEIEECDLIAIATRGRRTLGRVVLGSVADSVIRHSQIPILAVGPNTPNHHAGTVDRNTVSKIIVPLDGSSFAESALPFAKELAQKLSAEMVLVRVIDTGGPYVGLLDDAANVKVDADVKASAAEYLTARVEELSGEGLAVSSHLLIDAPDQRIAELAESTPTNVVVMATRAHWGPKRMLEGSLARTLIRSSGSPVVVIPPAAAA